jgi:hypothetical protein
MGGGGCYVKHYGHIISFIFGYMCEISIHFDEFEEMERVVSVVEFS